MKLSDISKAIDGELFADSDPTIKRLATPGESSSDSLVLCVQKALISEIIDTRPAAVITVLKLIPHLPADLPTIVVRDQESALTKLLEMFLAPKPTPRPRLHPSASIDPSAVIALTASIGAHCTLGADCQIGEGARIMPGAVLGEGVQIGDQCVIYPNAVILDHVQISSHTVIGPGAVIGFDGFSIAQNRLRPHIGNVVIGPESSIGANSCVDRGTIGNTTIGAKTHLDNLVQVGHNVRIGDESIVCGQAGIAGSANLGSEVVVGGQAGISQSITVTDRCAIAAQSGVTKNIEVSGRYSGHPAEPNRKRLRRLVALRKLAKDGNA